MQKNLGRHIGKPNGYVIVQAGHHHYRTPTIWKHAEPLWGDDLKLDVTDHELKEVVFTLWNQHKHLQDMLIGCVRIPFEDLKNQELHEKYYPLQYMHERDFVMGDVKLRLFYSPPKGTHDGSVSVLVKRARNLAVKDANGLSDPFVEVKVGSQKKKTKVIKRNLNPIWKEEFTFNVPAKSAESELVKVSVWDWDMVSSSDYMGDFTIPLSSLPPEQPVSKWFLLAVGDKQGREEKEGDPKSPRRSNIGELRIKTRYTEKELLPLSSYSGLLDLLLNEEEVLGWLYDTSLEPGILASILVPIFYSQGKATQLLRYLTRKEILSTKSSGVIFRSNTLATKCVDTFSKLIGQSFLHHVLHEHVVSINEDKKSCEIDPSKIEKGESVAQNRAHLCQITEQITTSIFNSADLVPLQLREVFHGIQTTITEHWPEDATSRYTAVSGFIFLRFFNPAILGPKLFGLLDVFPSFVTSRKFTLISKILQNLANLVEFGQKEPFLTDMNEFIVANMDGMKNFLDKISTLPPSGQNPAELADQPEIDLQVEMAHIHEYIKKKLPTIPEHHQQSSIFVKLNALLNEKEVVPPAGTTFTAAHRPSNPIRASSTPTGFLANQRN
jgi:hypothetical protein